MVMNYRAFCLMVLFISGCQTLPVKDTASNPAVLNGQVEIVAGITSKAHAPSFLGWANAHASLKKEVVIRGVRYSELLGSYPFYLRIKGTNWVAFFVNNGRGIQLKLVDILSGEAHQIKGDWAGYGYFLCNSSTINRDTVELKKTRHSYYQECNPGSQFLRRGFAVTISGDQ